jgi:2'-5' RNA ligase
MECDPQFMDRINSFALVNYLGGRIGEFLTRLRHELVPGCGVPAHLTVLPPRPLSVEPRIAADFIREHLQSTPPFPIEITGIEIFATTSVIYAEIGQGRRILREMHAELNRNGLAFEEPYRYHPHITLAQGIDPKTVHASYELARTRWQESALEKSFMLDKLTFVQNTADNQWIDLFDYELGVAQLK